MPLTKERPGLFHGRGPSGLGWFIVDPTLDQGALVAAWREDFESHNEPGVKRAARWAVGIVSYLVLLVLLALGLAAVREISWLYYPAHVLVGVIGLAGLIGAVVVAVSVVPSPPIRRPRVPGVVQVDPRVARWATDATPLDDIWDLSLAVDRFDQVLSAELSWTTGWDWDNGDRPYELVEDVITPVLSTQKSLEGHRLVRVAERVGFDLPPVLRREVPGDSATG
jgi:hypothetical protein